MGHGMMDHCRVLVGAWRGGTVVLSPRDLDMQQMVRLSEDLARDGGRVLLDPQMFLPQASHPRLVGHAHWAQGGNLQQPATVAHIMERLIDMNAACGAQQIILPGALAAKVDAAWLDAMAQVGECAQRLGVDSARAMQTIALSYDAVRDDKQVEAVVEAMDAWPARTIYLIAEAPSGVYLVNDPTWFANILDIVASARLSGKQVMLGYANQQLLVAACAGANAISSGTWMNVRIFMQNRFLAADEEDRKTRSTWYYAPNLFSEYRIQNLDIAQKLGLLDHLRTPDDFGSGHADVLFSSLQPTLAGFAEPSSFRHFLQCLRTQARAASLGSFESTLSSYRQALDAAQAVLERLDKKSVSSKQRNILASECIDAVRAGLHVLERNHGPRLRRLWGRLS